MSHQELLEKYLQAEPALSAWGQYVTDVVLREFLGRKSEAKSSFFAVDPKPRLKGAAKFVMKARSRRRAKGEAYTDPWAQITDKVGTRFVTLLEADALRVCAFIETARDWKWRKDVDFQQLKDEDPSRFLYASEHYIVWPKEELELGSVVISIDTPCEVQVRTLLQHAYSELTHGTTYKGTYRADNDILRRVARSMALIETTDGIFGDVTSKIREVEAPIEDLHDGLVTLWGSRFVPADDDTKEFSLLIVHDLWLHLLNREGLIDRIGEYYRKTPKRFDQLESLRGVSYVFRTPAALLLVFLLERQRSALRATSLVAPEEITDLEGATGILLYPDR